MPNIINGVSCRTKEESLDHLLNLLKKRKLGPTNRDLADSRGDCMYRYPSGRSCAVGALLSNNQLDWIKDHGLNRQTIDRVAVEVGANNLERVTGLTMEELMYLQLIHDENAIEGSPETLRDAMWIAIDKVWRGAFSD